MKYIYQIGIISGICFIGEMMGIMLPLPIPASVYGMILLFLLLMTKVIKLEQVEDVANYLLSIMTIFFIAPTVSLITALPYIKGKIMLLLLVMLISTLGTAVVTGLVAQFLIRIKNKRKRGSDNE